MTGTERKLKLLLDKVVKKCEKIHLCANYYSYCFNEFVQGCRTKHQLKKDMVIRKRTDSAYEIQLADVEIKQRHTFKYL